MKREIYIGLNQGYLDFKHDHPNALLVNRADQLLGLRVPRSQIHLGHGYFKLPEWDAIDAQLRVIEAMNREE